VFFLKTNYLNLMNAKSVSKSQLVAFALLLPSLLSGFKSATIMGANLKSNIIFPLWTAAGADFIPHAKIQSKVDERLLEHGNGHRLHIHWCFPGHWSKSFRNKPVKLHGQQTSTLDVIKYKAKQIIGDAPFLWVANKDIDDNEFDDFLFGKRIGNSPHGLNYYQGFDHAVFVSALNLTPAHIRFSSMSV
jgi:hypothetical protein